MKNKTKPNYAISLYFCSICYVSFFISGLIYVKNFKLFNAPALKNYRQISKEQDDLERNPKIYEIEVWGKASISHYLWKHIMKANLYKLYNGMMQVGNVTNNNILFNFKSGPAFIQTTMPSNVQYLVLVLNGRTQDKVKHATKWLEYLPLFTNLKKVAVVLLGNEKCENDWILPYMKSRGGQINVLFLVYDSKLVDNFEIYQWPLGVADYRGFPNYELASINFFLKRPFKYNFMGTIYQNSSRATLLKEIKNLQISEDVLLNERYQWTPKETIQSLTKYINALKTSDLTFSPVGKNTECYRLYEAMSLGSVPVVEDVVTPGQCDSSSLSPLRLLKQFNAPVIWIKNWNQLKSILREENRLSNRQIVQRRINLVKWYNKFKTIIKNRFLTIIKEKFKLDKIR